MTPPDRATLIAWVKDEASDCRASNASADHFYAIAALLEAEAWQDIATAPKDGTLVLVFYREGGIAIRRQTSEGWFDVMGRAAGLPTHWRPLPAPPVTEAR